MNNRYQAMGNFRIGFEAWIQRRGPATGKEGLTGNECERLNALETACDKAVNGRVSPAELSRWWNTFSDVGNNPRGNHYGVKFGYEALDQERDDFVRLVERTVRDKGFQFELGDVTVADDGE